MIRPDRLTIKAAEALQEAGKLARTRGNPVLNDAHLLRTLLDQDESIVTPLLQKLGVNVARLREAADREIGRFPRQSGTTGEPTMARELTQALDVADREAEALGDAYVSTEHLLLGLVEVKGTSARQLLAESKIGKDQLVSAINAVRGSHRVTDQEPEQKYQAL
ncbi:MAG: Clp protease N-terminal domain-containing protein, partial [Gemmatimonadales bacterium]